MTLEHYFNHRFQKDLALLQFQAVPQVLKDILQDPDLVLFGGKNWSGVAQDLATIEEGHRPHFILCLFALVATDQCMQTYFKAHYPRWRAQTAYPKFGWTRFGIYNENPLKLMSVPEALGLLDPSAACARMPEFVTFYKKLVQDYVRTHCPGVSADDFFGKLGNDGIFDLADGLVVPVFKSTLMATLSVPNRRQSAGQGYALAT